MLVLLANFLFAIAKILEMMLQLMFFIVIIQALLSWVNPDPYNPIVRFLNATTEPLLRPIRKYVPPLGGRIDITPIILLLLLTFLQYFLVASLTNYAEILHVRGMRTAV